MDTNLATIQVVSELNSIPNADAIEVASMKGIGWKCVVKKNEFRIGDLGVYISIDTIVPDKPEFEFLRNKSFKIKTIRLRGKISQGLLLPLSVLPANDYKEGQDLTSVLNITHYEKPIPENMRGEIQGQFPSSYVPKTDEIMAQSILPVLNEIMGKEVYITVKCDGTSATFANIEGTIRVCSRNLSLKESESNVYWKMYRKYNIDKALAEVPNYAIQGEICGAGIQKNKLGLTETKLFVFDVYDIKSGKYLNYNDRADFCRNYGLETVPLLSVCQFSFTLEQLLEMAKGKYDSGKNREGIVIRPVVEAYSPTIDSLYGRAGRMSFKVLNNDFLEKDED